MHADKHIFRKDPVVYMELEVGYRLRCRVPSDIWEHLPTLRKYAEGCLHITECGVRGAVSSYAFGSALQKKEGNRMILVDLDGNEDVTTFLKHAQEEGVDAVFYKESDLDCPIEQTDLLFIDTWHIYGHLKRELARWNPFVKKYILMHDTEVDGVRGETLRVGWNAEQQSRDTGIPVEEICKGLQPAIDEFLAEHPEWKIKEVFRNNNGLTVLERI